jgi:hypothetical protein
VSEPRSVAMSRRCDMWVSSAKNLTVDSVDSVKNRVSRRKTGHSQCYEAG